MTDEIQHTEDQQGKPKKSLSVKISLDFETAVEKLSRMKPEKKKSKGAKKSPDQEVTGLAIYEECDNALFRKIQQTRSPACHTFSGISPHHPQARRVVRRRK
jgi:hypothetical protein